MTAAAVTTLRRLNTPRVTLRFWQVLIVVALALPLLQPWRNAPGKTIMSSITFISGTTADGTTAPAQRDPATLIAAVLFAGMAARLLWLGAGFLRLRAIRRRATPATALDGVTLTLKQDLGTHADVMFSDEVAGPATVGMWPAVVLLPRRVLGLPTAVQKAVLCHELIHVCRRDWLATVLEEVWCAVLWFHPGARLMASRACLAREMLVDEETILHTRDRRVYAEALLAFSHPQPHLVGATALTGRRQLSQRIALIAQEASMSRSRVASLLVLSAATVAAATFSAATSVPMVSSHAQTEQVYRPGNGVTLPSAVREVKPEYTDEAKAQKIQGSVSLRIVVLADGTVGDMQVTRSLDDKYGLDRQAGRAATKWLFQPSTKDGKPVPVEVELEMTFTLR